MKAKNMNVIKEMHDLKKGIDDFLVKYSMMLKKYRVDLLVSTRRIIENRDELSMMYVDDIKSRQNEIHSFIDEINKQMTIEHVMPVQSNQNLEVSELDAVRMGVRIIKKDLPRLLSKRNFSFIKEYERIGEKESGKIVRNNLFLITKLKEDEIILLFSFLHSLYKELPRIIKGKGGVENGSDRKFNPN